VQLLTGAEDLEVETMGDLMWPFNIFITLAIPIGGGLGWLAFNKKEVYKKLFFPLIILVGVFIILSAVWDLSSSTTMSVVVPYFELGKFNDAKGAVDNVQIFSGLFVLNCIVTCGYLYLLRRSTESDNKKTLSFLRGLAESGNKMTHSLLRGFAESGNKMTHSFLRRFSESDNKKLINKEPLKKRGKNKQGGSDQKR
jgi:hypothetical protein